MTNLPHKKLTPWQRLDRIAFKYKVRSHGYTVREIANALLCNRNLTEQDRGRVKEILKEWAEAEN